MRSATKLLLFGLLCLLFAGAPAIAHADDASAAKARSLVNAAINMTDSRQAVKLLWQATDIDPTLQEAYVYLGLYYNSRSQFDQVVAVYKKLLKHQPNSVSAYLNVGEAYMSFSPPKASKALPYYEKAYKMDPSSSFAALRIGEILAHQGKAGEALQYLKQAASDSAKNPSTAAEARRVISNLGRM